MPVALGHPVRQMTKGEVSDADNEGKYICGTRVAISTRTAIGIRSNKACLGTMDSLGKRGKVVR